MNDNIDPTLPKYARVDNYEFKRGGYAFKVLLNPQPAEPIETYLGYCDGIHTVSSDRFDVCIRGLIRQHIVGLPAGELVQFVSRQERLAKCMGLPK